MMRPAHFPDDISHEGLRVSEKHQSAIQVVERIIDPCKTRAHAALDDHNRAGFIDVEDGHSEDGAAGKALSPGDFSGYPDDGQIHVQAERDEDQSEQNARDDGCCFHINFSFFFLVSG